MAKRGRPKKLKVVDTDELPEFHLSPGTKRGVLLVVFILLGFLSILALFDNAGALGRIWVKILGLLFGRAETVIPVIFFAMGIALFLSGRREAREDAPVSNLRVYLGAIFLTFALTGLLHVFAMRDNPGEAFELVKSAQGGGYFGVLIAFPLFSLLDFFATAIILAGIFIVSFVVLFNINIAAVFRGSRQSVATLKDKWRGGEKIKINQMDSPNFNVSKVTAPPAKFEEETATDQGEIGIAEADIPLAKPSEHLELRDKIEFRFRKGNWQLPSLSLLEESPSTVDSGNIEANVKIIEKTLADFGISVEMGEVNVGPTVTQYTLRPAQGIKLSQIVTLQNDLALALAARSIRIEAPIPGRALVGIEVPNKTSAMVRIKDVIKTDAFINNKSNLAFALGRDVSGKAMVADLSRMPHLLIAGATGTGKSVAINSIIISFLYRNSPEELRLIVIDPKRVELNLYNGIPHLYTPVVTDYDKAVNVLKWAVNEMDRRYNLLARSKKRNIIEYNSSMPEKMPYIVIIVDELADLMAVAQADIEAAVVRLAQMARAVGVHLVLATQRPSVDIITGLIKANITARMAFSVASQVDSRTIIDTAGAEKMLGAGDMLFVTAELGKPRRIQGTYISEQEVKNVVDFVQKQSGEVEYSEEILEKQRIRASIPGFEQEEGEEDEMLPEAIDTVKQAGKASASLLQRRLSIGYARAARLLDLMEQKGLIGPADGAKPRDVYMTGFGRTERDDEDI